MAAFELPYSDKWSRENLLGDFASAPLSNPCPANEYILSANE
jgi:hypothetical protein